MTKADIIDFILNHEGPEYNEASDADQESKWGITPPDLRHRRCPDEMRGVAIADITRIQAGRIIEAIYWAMIHGDDMPPILALAMIDCVMVGGDGIRFMQRAVRVNPDGVIGIKTMAAVNARDPGKTAAIVTGMRTIFYLRLVGDNAVKGRFADGWANRIEDVMMRIIED